MFLGTCTNIVKKVLSNPLLIICIEKFIMKKEKIQYKRTCHIKFKSEDLLLKFNIYGSQKKNWLPPGYGKKKYKEMTEEEKEVINEFQGEESYKKVCSNTEKYLFQAKSSQFMIES